jgi:hexulose-6-phosphate isomerase
MQGRLSPLVNGKIQAFPSKTWRDEFPLARECGFDLIEWVFDLTDIDDNPILSARGRNEIACMQKEHGISVPYICCDYFMEYPFSAKNCDTRLLAQGMLVELIKVCPEVGITHIELPLIGAAAIKEQEDKKTVINFLNDLVPLAEKKNIYLLLEVNLDPVAVEALLREIPSKRIQINYDTGNSAYWGFNPAEEIPLYGHRIGNIHIKDVTRKEYSVPLGRGEVDFEQVFGLLKKIGYRGDFVLQTARGEDHTGIAREFYQFTNHYIRQYLK